MKMKFLRDVILGSSGFNPQASPPNHRFHFSFSAFQFFSFSAFSLPIKVNQTNSPPRNISNAKNRIFAKRTQIGATPRSNVSNQA